MAEAAKKSSASNGTVVKTGKNQMEQVKQMFNKFDANGDGKISLSDLGNILNALGWKTSPEEVEQLMKEIDTDGDGFIDLNEFEAFFFSGANQAGDGSNNKELREAFNLYDKDKNGKISANELHSVLKSLGDKCSLSDCRKMIRSVDVDGDGHVNFEEFKRMMGGGT
ncbi:hypothetical protein ACH5RR_011625 [Cinchona calisaya]|uniref:EF-hand domain-containing protein n=1 Tax=Cinchona calisaya TaxID=153742 RepID=A0ABD3A6W3_9GENT